MQFLLFYYSKKSDHSWVYITFLRITQRILITNTFHWLELITVMLVSQKEYFFQNKIPPYFPNSRWSAIKSCLQALFQKDCTSNITFTGEDFLKKADTFSPILILSEKLVLMQVNFGSEIHILNIFYSVCTILDSC